MTKKEVIASVERLDLESTRAILRAKPALVTATDRQGRDLLHIACSVHVSKADQSRQARLVVFLLDRGFEIDKTAGRDACTPLFFAVARARNRSLVELLIRRGASVTSAPGGGLFAAGWWEDLPILELLIRAGAPVDVVVGDTPFLACWCSRRFEAAKCLVRHGADVNRRDRKGNTALHYGVEKQFDAALLKWLVSHGASPDIPDATGRTARDLARRKRDKQFLAALG